MHELVFLALSGLKSGTGHQTGLGFRVWGLGFIGFKVEGLGFKVYGKPLHIRHVSIQRRVREAAGRDCKKIRCALKRHCPQHAAHFLKRCESLWIRAGFCERERERGESDFGFDCL